MNLFNKLYTSIMERVRSDYYFDMIDEDMVSSDPLEVEKLGSAFRNTFTINNVEYEVLLVYIPKLEALRITFENKSKGTYKVTGDIGYAAMRVFSKVVGTIHGGLLRMQKDIGVVPKYIYFVGNTDEPSRISLYNKIIELKKMKELMAKFNYVPTDELYSKIAEYDRLNADQKEKRKFGNAKIYCFKRKDVPDVNPSSY